MVFYGWKIGPLPLTTGTVRGLFAAMVVTLSTIGPSLSQGWQCQPISRLARLVVERNGLRLNNFRLQEGTGFFSDRPYLELSFSAVNHNANPVFVSVQLAALDADRTIVLAMSAEPALGMVSGNATEQISNSVNTRTGELASVTDFCLRADGDF